MPSTAIASVRAMIDEIRIAPRVAGGLDLGHHLGGRDHALAGEMAAALGPRLVFDVHAGDAGFLVIADGAPRVDRIAVAGIGIGDHRQLRGIDDAAGVVDHFAWPSAGRRRACPAASGWCRSRSCRPRRNLPWRPAARRRPSATPGATMQPGRASSSRRRAVGRVCMCVLSGEARLYRRAAGLQWFELPRAAGRRRRAPAARWRTARRVRADSACGTTRETRRNARRSAANPARRFWQGPAIRAAYTAAASPRPAAWCHACARCGAGLRVRPNCARQVRRS